MKWLTKNRISPSIIYSPYLTINLPVTFYYVHTDHLGSITSVTNANGNIIARQNFDAWGGRRKVQDYSYLPQNTISTDNGLNNNGTLPKWLYRGYTGHEHLDEFALINMNARLYDPVVGMFLSPDNYIQAPGNTQNYNRYAYCLNNPLKYSDPSGNVFIADDIAAGLIGMGINLISQGVAGNITSWQSCLGYATVGFGSGIAGYYGTPIAGGAVAGAGNNFVAQMEANGWEWSSLSDVNLGQVAYSTGIGGISGLVGYGAGQWAGNHLGGIALNGLHISANSAIGGAITGSIGGAVGGYAGGFTSGLIMTGDFGAAHQSGLGDAIFGLGIGAGQGAISGYMSAKKAGLNPLTGKPNNSIVIGEGMTTDPIKGWMGVDKIAKDLGSDFYKPDSKIQPKVDGYGTTSELMYDNGVWIEIKIQQQVIIYDRGPVGNNSQYYNMEVGRTMDYPNVWKVKAHYNQTQTIRILIISK